MQLTEYAMPWSKKSYEQRMQGMMNVAACRPYRVHTGSRSSDCLPCCSGG